MKLFRKKTTKETTINKSEQIPITKTYKILEYNVIPSGIFICSMLTVKDERNKIKLIYFENEDEIDIDLNIDRIVGSYVTLEYEDEDLEEYQVKKITKDLQL